MGIRNEDQNLSYGLNTDNYMPFSKLKLYFALSRTQHGLLDMATPALCALLWLGEIPSLRICLLGLLTTFAGYTAVYALNDVVDYHSDKKKLSQTPQTEGGCLDDVLIRHPMAAGLLGINEGILWVVAWSVIAVIGAYLLNPVCVLIFLGGCALEVIYCMMLKISYLRTLISGAVKTTGSLAAVFAVEPSPSPELLLILFFWLFFWEIGGQNVALDWIDMEEDRQFKADTIPVRFGTKITRIVILGTMMLTVCLNGILFSNVLWGLEFPLVLMSLLSGLYLLVIPAIRLFQTQDRLFAIKLFNRASFYPPVLLIIIGISILF